MSPFARAMTMPLWTDSGLEVPDEVELRRDGDLAAIVLKGTSKVVGFVPSRFDREALPALIERLKGQQ